MLCRETKAGTFRYDIAASPAGSARCVYTGDISDRILTVFAVLLQVQSLSSVGAL